MCKIIIIINYVCNAACERRFLLRQGKEGNENTRSELYEVMKVNDGPRSWFIDNSVQTGKPRAMSLALYCSFWAEPHNIVYHTLPRSVVVKSNTFHKTTKFCCFISASFCILDGSLHMCTPIDPLFLALPYLLSAAQVVTSLMIKCIRLLHFLD